MINFSVLKKKNSWKVLWKCSYQHFLKINRCKSKTWEKKSFLPKIPGVISSILLSKRRKRMLPKKKSNRGLLVCSEKHTHTIINRHRFTFFLLRIRKSSMLLAKKKSNGGLLISSWKHRHTKINHHHLTFFFKNPVCY